MRQFGLDTVYAGLTIDREGEVATFDFSPAQIDTASMSIFDIATQGYGHDKALSAYVSLAYDAMLENITERGSIDIETDDTLFCCACAACSGEQEAGPVIIDGFATLASLMQSDLGDTTSETYLGDILEDVYGIDTADAAQYLFNPVTGEFVLVEGFDGTLTKGATLQLQDDGTGIVNAGGASTTATAATTGDQRIDAVINGDYWSGNSISYAFSLSAAPYNYAGTGNEAMPDNFNDVISAMQEASAHFALSSTEGVAAAVGFSVEGFTNLDINFLGNVDSTTAEIRFAETSDPGTGTARVADFPGGQVTSSPNDDGDIWFGTANNFRIAEAGNYQWMTMIHEIGHALGLKHGHQNYNFGVLPSETDSTEYSIMTYRSYIGQNPNGGATNEQWGFPQTFMMYDIATLQYFYGADFTVNSGDTVYTWTPGSGDTVIDGNVAISPGGNRIYATIWDGDGVDTYDLSAYATGVSVDLSPGGFSVFSAAQQASIGGGNFARGNIFNALQYQGDARSLIENAIGGAGDDTFVGNAADNSFTGGAGADTADYSAITDDLSVSLEATGGASSTEAGTDLFDSIENFNSGSGNDNIGGSLEDNVIKGGAGNDTISGMDGNDTLWGEVGDDMLFGGMGDDILRGGNNLGFSGPGFGDGMITRAAGAGNDSIANALNIDDEYSQAPNADVLDAETIPYVSVSATGDGTAHFYAFTTYSDGDAVTLDIDYGDTGGVGSFNSYLELYDANGNLLASNDFFPFVGGAGGSTSNDDAIINATIAAAGTYYIAVMESGGGGVPVDATYQLQVSVQNQTMTDPDTGDDTLMGGMGDDMLFGGAGTDYAQFSGVQANYTVTDNMDGTYLVIDNVGTDGTDTLDNIEFLIFSDVTVDIVTAAAPGGGGPVFTEGNDNEVGTAGDDVLNGLGGNDIIDGLGGDDTINGGDGADRLIGGEGADALNGDAGFDSVDYRGATSRVAFNVDTGGTVGEANGDTFSGIERYYLSDFNDTVTGSNANEFFYGEDGNDTINAGGGIDRLYGGNGNDIQRGQDGNDQLYGSVGADQLNGGAGFDIANYSLATAAVIVNMLSGGTGGDAAGDTYFGIEAVYGSNFDDSLTGNNSANELRGGDGDDALFGLGGNDRFFGGEGADSFDGGTGIDIVNYTLATGFVWVNLTTGGTFNETSGDSYTSIEWVFGSNFGDRITGDAANNRLEGRDGDDDLDGGAGNDRLLGGDGNDFIQGGDGIDTIFGGNGDDMMLGGDGNDFFFGGAGADSHDGDAGIDTVSYLASSMGLTVNMSGMGSASTGDAAGDEFFGIERIFGSGFDDTLIGGADAVTLFGNGGNDYLQGGDENDTLIGGAGVDSYGYDVNGPSADVIIGFTTNEVIYLLGNTPDFDTWAEVQAVGTDAGSNVIFDFGFGSTLTIVGHSLADLDASNFDFGGAPSAPPPASQAPADTNAFAADPADVFDMDALI
ncbi:M10 family metallopeptidase [Hellea balneolensis]|uniref:M10 family metallopeptidase n=1 Tax=Hellea balneolensis TaxID=287478 RepID=UPI000403B20F|nr:M10 family metallopeptidase [Hellea balneolensis]